MSRLICEQRAVAAAHAAQAEVKRMSGRLEAVDALGASLRALCDVRDG